MSSLKNKLIRLAYQKPELRNHLLPLFIKKYATLNINVFKNSAQELARNANINLKKDDSGEPLEADITEITNTIGDIFNKSLIAFNANNLGKVEISDVDTKKGGFIVGGGKIYNQNGIFTVSALPATKTQPASEVISYDIPKGFSATIKVIINLVESNSDSEILKKFDVFKEKKGPDGKPLKDKEGNEIKELVKTNLNPQQKRSIYLNILKNNKENWLDSFKEAINEKIQDNKTGIFKDILKAKIDEECQNYLPGVSQKFISPDIDLDISNDAIYVERIGDIMEQGAAPTPGTPSAQGSMEVKIGIGGVIDWSLKSLQAAPAQLPMQPGIAPTTTNVPTTTPASGVPGSASTNPATPTSLTQSGPKG
jgi:hypothetical protein